MTRPKDLPISARLATYASYLADQGEDPAKGAPSPVPAGASCSHDDRDHPDGTRLCFGDTCHLCENGKWTDTGRACSPEGSTC